MVHLGQLGDAANLDGPATVRHVWFEQIAGLLFHQLAEHFGAVENLAGTDRRLGLLADLGQCIDIAPLPADRILQPQQIQMLDVLADTQPIGHVERTVQIDRQVHVRPDRVAQPLDRIDDMSVLPAADRAVVLVQLPRIGHVEIELHRRVALGHHLPRHSEIGLRLVDRVQRATLSHLLPAPLVVVRRPVRARMAVAIHPHPVAQLATQ